MSWLTVAQLNGLLSSIHKLLRAHGANPFISKTETQDRWHKVLLEMGHTVQSAVLEGDTLIATTMDGAILKITEDNSTQTMNESITGSPYTGKRDTAETSSLERKILMSIYSGRTVRSILEQLSSHADGNIRRFARMALLIKRSTNTVPVAEVKISRVHDLKISN